MVHTNNSHEMADTNNERNKNWVDIVLKEWLIIKKNINNHEWNKRKLK